MAESDETDIEGLLSQMQPDIAQLMREMMTRRPESWPEAKAIRDRIMYLNKTATTDQEQGSLCFAFIELMNAVERDALVAPESVTELRAIARGDYRLMLSQQAMIGETIDPAKLGEITTREVNAGRLDASDDFHKFAEAGGAVLGSPAKTPTRKGWLSRLFS